MAEPPYEQREDSPGSVEAKMTLSKALDVLSLQTGTAQKIFVEKDNDLYWASTAPLCAKNMVRAHLGLFERLLSGRIGEPERDAFVGILEDFNELCQEFHQRQELKDDISELKGIDDCQEPKSQGRMVKVSRKYVERLITRGFFRAIQGTLDEFERKIRKEYLTVENLFKKVGEGVGIGR